MTRWVEEGLLQGRQVTPEAPWRIRFTEEDKRRLSAADAPQGWLSLKAMALALKVSQPTVLQRLKRGKLKAVRIMVGRRTAWRFRPPERINDNQVTLFD